MTAREPASKRREEAAESAEGARSGVLQALPRERRRTPTARDVGYSATCPKGWAATNVLVSEYIRWM